MNPQLQLLINSVLLGVGLAMDAFSVSLVDGMSAPEQRRSRRFLIAGVFATFQTAMPLIGWLLIRSILYLFHTLQRVIPWIAFILLALIGWKMIRERNEVQEAEARPTEIGMVRIFLQGIATSIDALSVGLAMADFTGGQAFLQAVIIGGVTFLICIAGIHLGRRIGTRISSKASVLGGVILIGIGLEILLTHLLGG